MASPAIGRTADLARRTRVRRDLHPEDPDFVVLADPDGNRFGAGTSPQ
ncbi:MAG TPA: hypothetical protein VJ617_12555 [Arthrobacter sp.]|nr:hypothetical protein [Arthrobacter sp.]